MTFKRCVLDALAGRLVASETLGHRRGECLMHCRMRVPGAHKIKFDAHAVVRMPAISSRMTGSMASSLNVRSTL